MSAKRQSSIKRFVKSEKRAGTDEADKPTKKTKPGKAKNSTPVKKDIDEEEKKGTTSKSKSTSDVSKNPLNSYEDFVGHLGDWQDPLASYLKTPHFKSIFDYVKGEYSTTTCYPPKELIFNAFKKVPFADIKVVIVGQDPYIKENEAMGLCFSVPKITKCPPSLKNIYKALTKDPNVDFKEPKPVHGDLQSWAAQGIFMLNAVLTVRKGASFSHAKSGWAKFTNEVIKAINREKEGVIFLCWGKKAEDICKEVDKSKHHVLKYGHPSPLSQKFMKFEECKHFSETNKILTKEGKDPINWNLE